jgi:CRISPR/Cas system-associated exonuclease Cas4 (RecB family)
VDKVFSCHEIKSGEQLIDKDIAVLMVQKVLNLDKKYAPFEIFDVEYRAPEFSLVVDETIFQLNGIIDRIDKKDNVFRIIDYKTSLTKNTTKTLDELFEFGKNNRAKAVLQILIYSLMFKQNHENGIITPFIYDLRSNLDDIYIYVGKNKILDFDDSLRQALLANIEVFIEKMMNTNKVFINHGPLCHFCKFATLCQKN